jgi:hypothetical protein
VQSARACLPISPIFHFTHPISVIFLHINPLRSNISPSSKQHPTMVVFDDGDPPWLLPLLQSTQKGCLSSSFQCCQSNSLIINTFTLGRPRGNTLSKIFPISHTLPLFPTLLTPHTDQPLSPCLTLACFAHVGYIIFIFRHIFLLKKLTNKPKQSAHNTHTFPFPSESRASMVVFDHGDPPWLLPLLQNTQEGCLLSSLQCCQTIPSTINPFTLGRPCGNTLSKQFSIARTPPLFPTFLTPHSNISLSLGLTLACLAHFCYTLFASKHLFLLKKQTNKPKQSTHNTHPFPFPSESRTATPFTQQNHFSTSVTAQNHGLPFTYPLLPHTKTHSPLLNQLLNHFHEQNKSRLLNTIFYSLNNKFNYSHFRRVPPDTNISRPENTLDYSRLRLVPTNTNTSRTENTEATQQPNTLSKITYVSTPDKTTMTPCPNVLTRILRSSFLEYSDTLVSHSTLLRVSSKASRNTVTPSANAHPKQVMEDTEMPEAPADSRKRSASRDRPHSPTKPKPSSESRKDNSSEADDEDNNDFFDTQHDTIIQSMRNKLAIYAHQRLAEFDQQAQQISSNAQLQNLQFNVKNWLNGSGISDLETDDSEDESKSL